MSNSIQDQLLKAGLVTEQQLDQARQPPPRPPRAPRGADGRGKASRGKGARGQDARGDDARGKGLRGKGRPRTARPERGEGAAPGQRRDAAPPVPALRPTQNKKTMRRRVRAYLDEHALNNEAGSVPYNFLRGTRIKRLYVTEEQRTRLLAGELLIAEVYSTHHILDPSLLPPLQKLLPETFVHRHEPGAAEPEAASAETVDDEYAGHEVPDDLIW